jgi:hypothetical protein
MSQLFEPGDQVPVTGIYKAVHSKQHVPTHHVTAISGDQFPRCLACHDGVRFELALSAVQVAVHPQFYR